MEIAKHKRRRSRHSESQALVSLQHCPTPEEALRLPPNANFKIKNSRQSKSPCNSRNDTRRNFGREFKKHLKVSPTNGRFLDI